MCDGQIKHMRDALDNSGFEDVAIMSYIKTDSCLFKPFKEAMTVCDAPQVIDGSKFRTDIINHKAFMQKVDLDISEGADMVIVKPALTNLDHILRVKQQYPNIPVAAYQVSGEYMMLKLINEHNIDENAILLETLSSIKRAGADMIFSYDAMHAAALLNSKSLQ
jgi:porphobilinogen synthase